MKKKSIFYVLIFFLTEFLLGQVKTQSFVDKKNIFLGDVFRYHIIIEYPQDVEIEKFEIYDVLKDTSGVENFILFDKKVYKSKKMFSNKIKQNFVFQLIPLKIGKLKIAELKINYINKISKETSLIPVPEIEIEIKPYPKPKNKKFDGEIIDIKGQIWIRNYFILIIFLVIILGILIYIIYQYKIKPIQEQNFSLEPQIDIKEIVLKKLNELWNKNYIDNNLIKEFYLELTEIVRWYIGEKYNINALELTTEELFSSLKKKIDKKYNLKLKSFLDNADLAKFAKYTPEKQQVVKDFETAKELIE